MTIAPTSSAPAVLAGLTLALVTGVAAAQDLPEKKQTRAGLYLTAVEAADMLAADDVLLLDVRTREEVAFVGLPARVDLHIPLMVMPEQPEYDAEKGSYVLEPNPDFELDFEAYVMDHDLPEHTPVIILCRSGNRSAKAANQLFALGYTQVYTVVDGFEGDRAAEGPDKGHRVVNGWRNAGLPWSYEIAPHQTYLSGR